MERIQIEKEFKELLTKIVDVEQEVIMPDANFFKDLGIDSLKAIEITVAIERHFKINVRDEQIPQITTLKQAVDAVENALKEKNG